MFSPTHPARQRTGWSWFTSSWRPPYLCTRRPWSHWQALC